MKKGRTKTLCAWFRLFILFHHQLERAKKDSSFVLGGSTQILIFYTLETEHRRWRRHRGWESAGLRLLVVDLVDCRLLIPRARHNVLVVYGDVAAQHGGRLLRLLRGTKESWTCEKRT